MAQVLDLVGDTLIEVLDCGGEFVGIGNVSVDGVALRNGARPLAIRLDTPTGVLYTRLLIQQIVRCDEGWDIELKAVGLPWGRGEYLDDYGQPIQWLSEDLEPVSDTLTLLIRPAALELGCRTWRGFSYAFRFDSDSRQIHRLQTHATWEIGGRITDNTVLSQGQCNKPVYHGSQESLFTTACLRTLDAYGSPQANSFQLASRCGLVQGFDFQHSPQGALLQYWPQFANISSLVESPPGSDVLHMIDEYRFDLSGQVQTLAKHVLFTPGELQEHEARDLWYASIEHIYGGIREQYHVARTLVKPMVMMSYDAVLKDSPAEESPDAKSRLNIRLADVEVDHAKMLYAVADSLLPRMVEQGIRRFFPDVISESDVTELGLKRKLDDGMHGDLHCASICATHRFFPAEYWGGIKAWRYLYERAQSLGIELGHWFAPHFSPRSPQYAEHPEYRMIDAMGMPAGGGYGFQTLVVADWNTGIYQRTFDDMKQWHEEGGLDFLFIDSYSNMGMLQLNYSEKMRSNFAAFSRLLSDLQGIGIRSLTFESISPFGINSFGVADLRGDQLEQNRAVAGQNDFGWWVGEEDMAIDCSLFVSPRDRTPEELSEFQFRAMANRGYLAFHDLYDVRHILPEWWSRANRVYNLVSPHMKQRNLLPDRGGVRWTDGDTEVLWLYKDMTLATRTVRQIERVNENGFELLDPETTHLAAWQVYRIRPY